MCIRNFCGGSIWALFPYGLGTKQLITHQMTKLKECIEQLGYYSTTTFDSNFFVKELTDYRQAKGITQKEIAQKMKCSQSRISKLEKLKTKEVRLGDLKRYAQALGLDFEVKFL